MPASDSPEVRDNPSEVKVLLHFQSIEFFFFFFILDVKIVKYVEPVFNGY